MKLLKAFLVGLLLNGFMTTTYAADIVTEWNEKCGPLSGKTPNTLDDDQRHQCEELAARANEFLRLSGPGFQLSDEARKKSEAYYKHKAEQDACNQQGTFLDDCAKYAPVSLQIQRRKEAVDKYCQDQELPPGCKGSEAVPGRSR